MSVSRHTHHHPSGYLVTSDSTFSTFRAQVMTIKNYLARGIYNFFERPATGAGGGGAYCGRLDLAVRDLYTCQAQVFAKTVVEVVLLKRARPRRVLRARPPPLT